MHIISFLLGGSHVARKYVKLGADTSGWRAGIQRRTTNPSVSETNHLSAAHMQNTHGDKAKQNMTRNCCSRTQFLPAEFAFVGLSL